MIFYIAELRYMHFSLLCILFEITEFFTSSCEGKLVPNRSTSMYPDSFVSEYVYLHTYSLVESHQRLSLSVSSSLRPSPIIKKPFSHGRWWQDSVGRIISSIKTLPPPNDLFVCVFVGRPRQRFFFQVNFSSFRFCLFVCVCVCVCEDGCAITFASTFSKSPHKCREKKGVKAEEGKQIVLHRSDSLTVKHSAHWKGFFCWGVGKTSSVIHSISYRLWFNWTCYWINNISSTYGEIGSGSSTVVEMRWRSCLCWCATKTAYCGCESEEQHILSTNSFRHNPFRYK